MAFLYTNYVTPVYKFSGRLLIKATDGNRFHKSNRFLSGVNNLGAVSKTLGIENEVERIWSSSLLRDVVIQLKLYTDYWEEAWPKDRLVYGDQPVSVDLDPIHLDTLDQLAYDEFRSITMRIMRENDKDSTIIVKGVLDSDDEVVWSFSRRFKSLPASIATPFGTLTFTHNPNGKPMVAGRYLQATIYPPLYKALTNLGHLSVTPVSTDYTTFMAAIRYYYRLTSIANLTLTDQNKRRGMDIIRQLVVSYNRMANAEKNEIALRSEEFINERIALLGDKLGSVDSTIVDVKQQYGMTSLTQVTQSLKGSDRFSSKIADVGAQIMMIDALKEYVENPSNRYDVIPTNIGLNDGTTIHLINEYNTMVQKRKNLLKSASETSLPVKQLSASIDETRSAVITAIQQARNSADISRAGVESQFARHQGQVLHSPTVERALKEANREQFKRARLYRLLLQKREENIIALTSVADHGRLIDEPLCEGRVRPNLLFAYGVATGFGIVIPYVFIFLTGLFRYKLRGHEDLASLTEIPIIADVPLANERDKSKAGIVVKEGVNSSMDEVFRLMRSNLQFMLRGGSSSIILFTSNTSGEGKTFNAANLAVSYALLGKRVILCGLDIRKPALGILFNLPDKTRGISTLLSMATVTASDVRSQIQPSGVNSHLDLLLAGPIPPNPTELLASETFRQIVAVLKENYDCVILDTAPIGLVTDTLQICKQADVTVYVCRARYTPKYTIDQLNTLKKQGIICNPCIVLNGCFD